MSRVEELQGWRWAKEVCLSVKETFKDWKGSLLTTLERGLVEKPEGYKIGVMKMIEIVRSVPDRSSAQIEPDE